MGITARLIVDMSKILHTETESRRLNPYEPPKSDLRFNPFHERFWRGLKYAVREYRAGLMRENLSLGEHIQAWLALILFGVFVLVNAILLTVNVLEFLGLFA